MTIVVAIYVVSFDINVDNSNINLTIDSFVLSMTISSIMSTSSIVDTLFEIVLLNNITIYDQANVVNKLTIIVDSFSNI